MTTETLQLWKDGWTHGRANGFVPWSMFHEEPTANAARPKEVYFFHSGNPAPPDRAIKHEPPEVFPCTDYDVRCELTHVINGLAGYGFGWLVTPLSWEDLAHEIRRRLNDSETLCSQLMNVRRACHYVVGRHFRREKLGLLLDLLMEAKPRSKDEPASPVIVPAPTVPPAESLTLRPDDLMGI